MPAHEPTKSSPPRADEAMGRKVVLEAVIRYTADVSRIEVVEKLRSRDSGRARPGGIAPLRAHHARSCPGPCEVPAHSHHVKAVLVGDPSLQ
jgi:hypothetical protein